MEDREKSKQTYIGYEYKSISVNSTQVSMYMDAYECFGWKLDEKSSVIRDVPRSLLRFKRERKIINKQELTRLQRNFEDCMDQINRLEQSKNSKATMYSIGIGLIGTAFMAGSVFAITASSPIIWLCVLLAIPGFTGWILPVILFHSFVMKRNEIVSPLMEEKYNEIYELFEKGNRLLGKTK